MILNIAAFPAEILRKKAEPVEEITEEIKTLIADMIETLYNAKGYGLAAPQVNRSLRIFVVDRNGGKSVVREPEVFINPEITAFSGEIIADEGCLSLPGEFAPVKRYAKVTLTALNEKGESVILEAVEQRARALQHEMDHLNGVLFLDHLPSFRKDTIKKHIKRRIQSGDYPQII
ncbi:MAG: peptide deformylase [Deferribacteraceae bacterium]|jgi:peptide deformylase|nr:peptide deformylase [Deferribacteraceae bacterium]